MVPLSLQTNLTDEFKPKIETRDLEVPVPPEPSTVLPSEPERAAQLARSMDMVPINRGIISQMKALGEEIEGVSTVRVADGFIAATQEQVLTSMGRIAQKMDGADAKQLKELGHVIGYLANSMAKCSQVLKLKQQPNQAKRNRPSSTYEPGKAVLLEAENA